MRLFRWGDDILMYLQYWVSRVNLAHWILGGWENDLGAKWRNCVTRVFYNCYILRRSRHLWFLYLILMARKMDAKTIPTLAAEASTAYRVMSTVECSMMRTVLSFGGGLPSHNGCSLLVRFRMPVMLSYSPTFTSWPSKRMSSHSSKNAHTDKIFTNIFILSTYFEATNC